MAFTRDGLIRPARLLRLAVVSSLLGDATFPLAAVFAGVDQLEA
jgi:hypothetical protein